MSGIARQVLTADTANSPAQALAGWVRFDDDDRTFDYSRRLSFGAVEAVQNPTMVLTAAKKGTLTRWRIEAAASRAALFDASAPGAPAWRLTLERSRGVTPARSWTVEFGDVAYGFRLAPRFSDRAAEAGERRQALSG